MTNPLSNPSGRGETPATRSGAAVLEDSTGVRRRRVRAAGRIATLLFVLWLASIMLGGLGLSPLPLPLPIPGLRGGSDGPPALSAAQSDLSDAQPAPEAVGTAGTAATTGAPTAQERHRGAQGIARRRAERRRSAARTPAATRPSPANGNSQGTKTAPVRPPTSRAPISPPGQTRTAPGQTRTAPAPGPKTVPPGRDTTLPKGQAKKLL